MTGDIPVIENLNQLLSSKLICINQCFLHARMCQNWGLESLGALEYHKSTSEMKRADRLIKRILFLEGLPNAQGLGRLDIGEHTKEMLECDLRIQKTSHADFKAAIVHCEIVGDFGSREPLEDILGSEGKRIDWLETQPDLINQVGIKNYLQSQMSTQLTL